MCGYTDEEDQFHELPYRWEICGACRGEGKSSAYLGAFTRDDFNEDPEFAEDYMAGLYDRTCEDCKGTGKVKVVDRERASEADLQRYDEEQRIKAEMEAEQYSEWLHCGGWRELGWR